MTLEAAHRRFNPLTREWVLVSPQRAERPWLGQTEELPSGPLPAYDATCYLCPRNERAGGIRNADYEGTFVFDNDFPALLPAVTKDGRISDHPLLDAIEEPGLCRVVCFSPRHDLTLPELELPAIQGVITTWAQQTAELKTKDFVHNVQVFENKGEIMGCSNPHPHSQIWAQAHTPNEVAKEVATQSVYWETRHRWLLLEYAAQEHRRGERTIAENDRFIAVVPFWAIWPFEVLVIALRPCAHLTELMANEILDLADVIRQVTTRYDNLFESSFPYSMGIHQAPFDDRPHPEWTLHAHFYPPLLRSASVRKFMVGYEMLAMPQRDITPESAAARLRAVSAAHYKKRGQDAESVP